MGPWLLPASLFQRKTLLVRGCLLLVAHVAVTVPRVAHAGAS